jgi:hypothetical protein
MITKRLGVEHLGFRILALIIALILWITVISQKDMVTSQKVSIQFLVPPEFKIESQNEMIVEVKVEGPRPILKRFLDKFWPTTLVIPIREPRVGPNSVEIPVSYLQLPTEIKVLSILPREVVLQIIKNP